MTSLQEYDIEFKAIHTIKDHGLWQLAVEAEISPEDDSPGWEKEI